MIEGCNKVEVRCDQVPCITVHTSTTWFNPQQESGGEEPRARSLH